MIRIIKMEFRSIKYEEIVTARTIMKITIIKLIMILKICNRIKL